MGGQLKSLPRERGAVVVSPLALSDQMSDEVKSDLRKTFHSVRFIIHCARKQGLLKVHSCLRDLHLEISGKVDGSHRN